MRDFSQEINALQIAIDATGMNTSAELDSRLLLIKLQSKVIEDQRNYWVDARNRQLGNITSKQIAA